MTDEVTPDPRTLWSVWNFMEKYGIPGVQTVLGALWDACVELDRERVSS